MATGTVTAREPQGDGSAIANAETAEASTAQPLTLKQRVVHMLHHIFAGREEHLGWHQ
jgi:hypothetical protein